MALLLMVAIPFVLALGMGWTILRIGGGLHLGSGAAAGFLLILLTTLRPPPPEPGNH
jgi:hypothetical protein